MILLGISKYDQESLLCNLGGVYTDLVKSEEFWANHYKCSKNNIFWDRNKQHWLKEEINTFLLNAQKRLTRRTDLKINNLIICLFGHGNNENDLITSNGEFVSIADDIESKFTGLNKLNSKLCLVDSCCNINKINYNINAKSTSGEFVTLSSGALLNGFAIENSSQGGLFTSLLHELCGNYDCSFTQAQIIVDNFLKSSTNNNNQIILRGLRKLELNRGKIYVRMNLARKRHEMKQKALTEKEKIKEKELKLEEQKGVQFGRSIKYLRGTVKLAQYEARIPQILVKLKRELTIGGGLETEGIFLTGPDIVEFINLKVKLNSETVKSDSDYKVKDIHCIAYAIKVWYRDMPIKVLNCFKFGEIISGSKSVSDANQVMNRIPQPYRSLFEWLLDLANDVIKKSSTNKMNAKNISIVLSPYLYDQTIENKRIIMSTLPYFVEKCMIARQQQHEEDEKEQERTKKLNDIIISSFHVSKKSDSISYDKELVGIVIYQYKDVNKWTWNNVNCQSGYSIVVDKKKLNKLDVGSDNYFEKLYYYRFGQKLTKEIKNYVIGVQFEIIKGAFVSSKHIVGKHYGKYTNQIFDKFGGLSEMELVCIRHVLEYYEKNNNNNSNTGVNLPVTNMIKKKYLLQRTWNIHAFKPLIQRKLDSLSNDLWAKAKLTTCRGYQVWRSPRDTNSAIIAQINRDSEHNSSGKAILKAKTVLSKSLYFASKYVQSCYYDPLKTKQYSRHLRQLFIFCDNIFKDYVMTKYHNNEYICILDLCDIARKYGYTVDSSKTFFLGKDEVDYAIYFVKQSEMKPIDDENDNETHFKLDVLDRSYSAHDLYYDMDDLTIASLRNAVYNVNIKDKESEVENDETKTNINQDNKDNKDDKDDKDNQDNDDQDNDEDDEDWKNRGNRDKCVSIINGNLHFQVVEQTEQKGFNINQFEMCRYSDSIDKFSSGIGDDMIGMVIYLYENESLFKLGGLTVNAGLIYMRKRKNISSVKVIRNTWHDKLFKSLFNCDLNGKIFGAGFKITHEEFVFDSTAFDFKLNEYYGKEFANYGSNLEMSEAEKRCIMFAVRNWNKHVKYTKLKHMMIDSHKNFDAPIENIDNVFKPCLSFTGPFLKAYEIQSSHVNRSDELLTYQGNKIFELGDHKSKALLFENKNANAKQLKSLYVRGFDGGKGLASGQQAINAIEKKYRIMGLMKLEYICDIAVRYDFTVGNMIPLHNNSRVRNHGIPPNEFELYMEYTGNAPQITNGFVILLGISQYIAKFGIPNLDGVNLDMKKHRDLWEKTYNFDVFPSEQFETSSKYINKQFWEYSEIESFFKLAVDTFNDLQIGNKYDGIICAYSGHGSAKNTILTSNGNFVDLHVLMKEYFSDIRLKRFPRLFFVDACRFGSYDIEKDKSIGKMDSMLDDMINEDNKENDSVNLAQEKELKQQYRCICNLLLTRTKVEDCYKSARVRCNQCKNKYGKGAILYHCTAKYSMQHPNGYDICQECMEKKIEGVELHFDKNQAKCICNNRDDDKSTLKKMKIQECYGGGKRVRCNVCHKRYVAGKNGKDVYIYHCSEEYTDVHGRGYDICVDCMTNEMNCDDLVCLLYGNSPLHTTTEDNNGGLFTTSVLKQMTQNVKKCQPLYKLTGSMNLSLNDTSSSQQIVFKEGSVNMDKLIIIPSNKTKPNGKQNSIIDDDIKLDETRTTKATVDKDEEERKRLFAKPNAKTKKFEAKQKKLEAKQKKLEEDYSKWSFYQAAQIHTLKDKPVKIAWWYENDVLQKWKDAIDRAVKIVESKVPGLTFYKLNASDSKNVRNYGINKTIRFYSVDEKTASTYGNVLNDKSARIRCGKKWNSKKMNGSALHELLHALGVQHEHKRNDRSDYGITLDDKKIKSNEKLQKKIKQYQSTTGALLTRYDPHSIMNYQTCVFTLADNLPTYFSNSPLQGKERLTILSPLDELGMNILWPPAKRNDSKMTYNPTVNSKTTNLYYCGRVGSTENLNYPLNIATSGVCGPNEGPNCAACRVLKNDKIPTKNKIGTPMWQGSSGRFYCGKFFAKMSKHHDGNCGPDTGHQCPNCRPYMFDQGY